MNKSTWLGRNGIYMAWVVSLIATAGSLFFSEILHWQPCELCWFQRIFMYPQVLILGIACLRNDKGIWPYSMGLSTVGALFSIYHYLVQHVAAMAEYTPCSSSGVSCESDYFNLAGFITIPFLAGTAFILIIVFTALVGQSKRAESTKQNTVTSSVNVYGT